MVNTSRNVTNSLLNVAEKIIPHYRNEELTDTLLFLADCNDEKAVDLVIRIIVEIDNENHLFNTLFDIIHSALYQSYLWENKEIYIQDRLASFYSYQCENIKSRINRLHDAPC